MNQAPPTATVSALLADARTQLNDPREALLLVAHALGLARETLYAHPERAVGPDDVRAASNLIEARKRGAPIAYLTGKREFYGLAFAITPAVLIPRPETELLVELALAKLDAITAPTVADLGTGSGAVALAIAHTRPDARVIAADRSTAALAVAAANAHALDLAQVNFVQADWLAPFAPQVFDLIVSNPPYVAAGDVHLGQGDLRFEPRAALAAGADGLDAIHCLIGGAVECLKSGGTLILEHGAEQQAAVGALLAEQGYAAIETHRDLAGLPRAACAIRPH